MDQLSINTPALLFPAITLLMLAYTNRFLTDWYRPTLIK
jgi:Protein of unknown function (DUF2721)